MSASDLSVDVGRTTDVVVEGTLTHNCPFTARLDHCTFRVVWTGRRTMDVNLVVEFANSFANRELLHEQVACELADRVAAIIGCEVTVTVGSSVESGGTVEVTVSSGQE